MILHILFIPLLSVSIVRGRTAAAATGGPGAVRTERAQELDRALIQQLRERCEQQALQLESLQAQLKKASLCLDVFSITTQHFCQKVGCSRDLGSLRGTLVFLSLKGPHTMFFKNHNFSVIVPEP